MRFKYNKEIEFFFKKYLFPQHLLLKKRIERSIRKKDENEIDLLKKLKCTKKYLKQSLM